jgi:4-amino-4-deoxy-L-arabinose transferase-like glycosyltransferase
METSLRMFNALAEARWLSFLYEYCGSFGGSKAPLISVTPLPFLFLFGKRLDPTFLVNGSFLVLSCFYLYALVRRWYPAAVALLSVVVFQTFPAVAGLCRWYLTDYGLATLVIVFLYYLAASDNLRSGSANLALGATLGLGLLMKVVFPAFVAGPLLLTWLGRRDGFSTPPAPGPDGRWRALPTFATRYPLAFISLIGGLIASSWYALNLRRVLAFAWANVFGPVAADYRPADLSRWLLDLPHQSISLYYALALPACLLAALVILSRRGELSWRWPHSFCLAWFIPAGCALLSTHNDSARFAAPGLAVLAIILARALLLTVSAISGQRGVQAAMLGAVLAVPLLGFVRVTLGAPAFAGNLYRSTYWYHPPDQQGQWNQERVLEALRELAPAQQPDCTVIVGVEHPYLNANLFNYLKQREGSRFTFAGFGYAESSLEQAIRRISTDKTCFILMAEGFDESELPPFLNQVNAEVQHLLDAQRLPFRHRTTMRLTDRIALRIYERQQEGSSIP